MTISKEVLDDLLSGVRERGTIYWANQGLMRRAGRWP